MRRLVRLDQGTVYSLLAGLSLGIRQQVCGGPRKAREGNPKEVRQALAVGVWL